MLIARYGALPVPSVPTLIPLVLAVMLIPLQALLLDWFNANTKSLKIENNKIIYTYSPNSLYSDLDEIEVYDADNIDNIKIRFEGFGCLQSVKVRFKDKKILEIMGFYMKDNDFRDIVSYLKNFSRFTSEDTV
jgi:hypothetical protein